MPRRLRLPAVLLAAVAVAQVAVVVMRPRDKGPEPAPVEARDYFTKAQIERARDFRRPQLVIYGATVAIELGVLVLLVRRPPRWLHGASRRQVPAGALAGAAVSALPAIAQLPVSAIGRQRAIDVGLTTRSWPGWLADVGLDLAISAGLAAVGGALLVVALRRLGRAWWTVGAALIVVFGVAITYGSPVLIDPLFNRFEPLEPGRTRSAVLDLARRADVDVGEVYVVDASKRTTGANAYVAGIGKTKRVVLFDTLLRDFTPAQVRLVVAHELGHVHHRDVSHGLLWLAVVAPFGVLAAARLAERLGPDDWRARPAPAVPAVALALAIVVPVITTISNELSREVEARADRYALALTHQPDTLIAFQRMIAIANVSDPQPPGWVNVLLGTHPTAVQRIGAAVAFRDAMRREARPRPTPAGS
ncbi:MAG TPA: M48 family metallopeptidase [Solirubrobacteraceae bacterium]|jgi:STE24 endopeptidase